MNQYEERVTQAADAWTHGVRAALKLARLTREACGPKREVGHTRPADGFVTYTKWAADVESRSGRKFSAGTASIYGDAWDYLQTHPGADWSEAYDDARGGESPNERMASHNVKRGLEHATPEVKAAALAQLIADPDVRQPRALATLLTSNPRELAVAFENDDGLRRAIGNLQTDYWRDHGIRNPIERRGDTVEQKLAEVDAALALQKAFDTFADSIDEIRPNLGNLPQRDAGGIDQGMNWMVRSAFKRAEDALESVRSFAVHGKSDVEAFLGSVLRQESNP